MKERKWPTPLTHEEMRERLATACCALDKLSQWTDEDESEFGDKRSFAKVAIELVMRSGKSRLRHCPDCGVAPGQMHVDGCDVEICSVCGDQYLMCGCKDHDKAFARWTGFWPGSLEADALGIDLNELHGRELEHVFFIKPIFENPEAATAR